jgi:hypothetical protein
LPLMLKTPPPHARFQHGPEKMYTSNPRTYCCTVVNPP